MGVVGYGDIGQAAARMARVFGMRILALRRRVELSAEEQAEGLQVRVAREWMLTGRATAHLGMSHDESCQACSGNHARTQVYPPDELCEMMAASDYVVMALPLTPETYHFVDAAAIAAMRPNAVLINVGRGKNLEEAALITGVLPDQDTQYAGHLHGGAQESTPALFCLSLA